MKVNEKEKHIANHINGIVGGTPNISRYYDKNETSYVDIMTIYDVPEKGVAFYSTIGVSEYSIGLKCRDVPLRVELIFTVDQKEDKIANMLATSAFCIINSGYKCYPGEVFKDIISSYINNIDMKHVMFVQPFLWDYEFKELKLDDIIIEWLLAVPISEKEYQYAEQYGSDALEELFEKNEIDIFNINRKSIL